jgi:hypothetical protein
MTAATLREIVEETDQPARDVLPFIVSRLSDADREVFLAGLSERLVCDQDDAQRWLGSWYISTLMADSATFNAQSENAQRLIDAGQLGDGITHAELLARYGRTA